MIPRMKLALWISAGCSLAFGLTSCGTGGGGRSGATGQQPGIGPFDPQGRYREDWADNPSMWRKPGSSSTPKPEDVPQVAQNEQPPMNSVPLASSPQPKPTIAETKPKTTSKKQPEAVVVKSRPLNASERQTASTKTKAKAAPEAAVKKKAKSEPEVAKTKAKTKPKTVVKVTPKSTLHVVKPGDSLSSIASRYGCSVSALQSANGISGTLIRDGRTLKIPKK